LESCRAACFVTDFTIETRQENYRCNQAICDFADALFPDLEPSVSCNTEVTGYDGIHEVTRSRVLEFVEQYNPVVLRDRRTVDTLGLPAINFGVSKGSTYDHVLIFPTGPMLKYLSTRRQADAGSLERFYVAVTRARYSVTFVVPD
jgi:hypothetical protein